MALVGTPLAIGTASTTLLTCPATQEASLHSLLINNPTSGNLSFTLSYFDSSSSAEQTLLTQTVSSQKTLKAFEAPVNLASLDKINASASASGLVALVSSFQNTSTPVEVGFTPRGEYTSGTTYAINDVVSNGGSSFISQFAGNLNRGTSNSSAWLTLAAKGDTGDVSLAGTAELTNKSFGDSVTVSASLTANTVNDVDGNLRTVPPSRTFGAGVTDAATASALDVGNFILMTGTAASVQNLTIPSGVFTAGDVFTLVNTPYGGKTAASTTTISAAATAFVAGGESATAVISLGFNGVATVLFASTNGCFITGNVE